MSGKQPIRTGDLSGFFAHCIAGTENRIFHIIYIVLIDHQSIKLVTELSLNLSDTQ